ncbi:MAG TPA: FoF1 ATP synthase subunit gamma [Terriglobia bacterium]|nr:FoF1 ATP synthase subunit gamma [Terriglobia bacterium]
MTERLSDIEARIATVHQLEAVISAMRGIAAARMREARERLDGIRAYAQAVAAAIGGALAFLPDQFGAGFQRDGKRVTEDAPTVILALCAEQGFAGSFSARVLDRVQEVNARAGNGAPEARQAYEILLVGDRGLMTAQERNLAIGWSAAMVAHVDEVPALANRIADVLYARIGAGAGRVLMVHAVPDHLQGEDEEQSIVVHQLVPFDYARFPVASRAVVPVITLPPQILLEQLTQEFVFAEICEALILSFSAENEARMRAMVAARSNVAHRLDDLVADHRRLRQDEITNELVELAGATAAGSPSS